MTITEKIETLMLNSWGSWARVTPQSLVGIKMPGWVRDMETGYKAEPVKYPSISDEYGLKIDRMIAALHENERSPVVLHFVFNISCRRIDSIMGWPCNSALKRRDDAINQLYGALKLR